jgi:hypothetical protein
MRPHLPLVLAALLLLISLSTATTAQSDQTVPTWHSLQQQLVQVSLTLNDLSDEQYLQLVVNQPALI